MKLGLAQLHEGENPFQFSENEAWVREVVGRLEKQGTRLVGQVAIQLVLTKLEPDYYLRGQLAFSVEQTCGRCAEAFTLPIVQTVELGLAHVKTKKPNHDELSEESDELDVVYFEGFDIDLAPLIEEQILLSIPYAPICRADCKGICQTCGADLNLGRCRCQKTNPLNPFSALADLKNH
jgi:uncharacterized protein